MGVTRDEALAHAQAIVGATALPVQGDFENGFGDDPDTVAETVRLAAEIGLAGICIEDVMPPDGAAYGRELAVERIRAAVAATRALPRDFVLTARADGVMTGVYGMDEALERLRAFEAVGADCVYLPMPPNTDAMRRACGAVSVPVNVLAAGPFAKLTLADFANMGAARISLGSALARATHRLIADAGRTMFEHGDFTPLTRSIPGTDVDEMLERGAGASVDRT